ncbi:MAG: hypothetical protein U5J83_08450 [Bryobacterales bacterium]|nr:hypothetical protein [Bryobacterales bacterium]
MGTMNSGGDPNPGGFPPQQPQGAPAAGLQQNVAAALCYLLGVLSGIIFLVLEPYNKDRLIRFHAFQSIFLWVAVIVLGIGLSIVSVILGLIPMIGWIGGIIVLLLSLVLWVGVFGVWVYLMYKAYNNERVVLPLIGPLAEKQA